jgi:hypothetical protein
MIRISITVCLAIRYFTAFDYRQNSPASLFPQNQAAIDITLPDSASNPAYFPRIKYPYLHFSGCRPYNLDELYSTTIRAGYGDGAFGMQASWSRFGFDQYLENIAEASAGYCPIKYISLGAGLFYYNVSIHTPEVSLSGHLCDGRLSILIAPFEWIDLSFQYENVVSLFIKSRRDILYPGWSGGAGLKPIKGLSLIWNITSTPYGFVNSLAASINILKYFSIRAGYARESSTYSAAVSFIYKYVSASYGLKYHPHLGLTHSFGVSLAAGEIAVEALNYGEMFNRIREIRGIKKIDISSCSLEELLQIPDFDELFAGRIIKYRNNIGPVSKDAFIQIGMNEQEARRVMKYITGLADESPKPKKAARGRKEHEKAQKEIFQKLLREGLPASLSLELSEMAVRGQVHMIRSKLGSLTELDQNKKKRIMQLCAGPF